MKKRMPTKITLEELAVMVKKGFDETVSKKDLERFATKKDLEGFATKQDLERFATKKDLEGFATKQDLERFATKKDLERFATKEDLLAGFKRIDHRFDKLEGKQQRTERETDICRHHRALTDARLAKLEAAF